MGFDIATRLLTRKVVAIVARCGCGGVTSEQQDSKSSLGSDRSVLYQTLFDGQVEIIFYT